MNVLPDNFLANAMQGLPSPKDALDLECRNTNGLILLKQRFVDADGYLLRHGLKLYWSDDPARGHCSFSSLDLWRMTRRAPNVRQWAIYGLNRIKDSSHPAVHSVFSLPGQGEWSAAAHPPKPSVHFSEPVFEWLALMMTTSDDVDVSSNPLIDQGFGVTVLQHSEDQDYEPC